MMNLTLDTLLAPLTITDLQRYMLERSLRRLPAQPPETFRTLLDWDKVEELLARDAIHPGDYRFYKQGHEIKIQGLGLIDGNNRLSTDKLPGLIKQGVTIVANRAERKLPELWSLSRKLQGQTGAQVTVAFVASFECPKALNRHYDFPDNIVLQMEGSKRWQLYGDPIPGSGRQRTLEQVPDALSDSIELHPGDGLFIPSGLHHECASRGNSLHLSILLEWPTGVELVRQLMKISEEDEAMSEPLRQFADADTLAKQESLIKQRLHQLIDSLSAKPMLDRLAEKARLAEPPNLVQKHRL